MSFLCTPDFIGRLIGTHFNAAVRLQRSFRVRRPGHFFNRLRPRTSGVAATSCSAAGLQQVLNPILGYWQLRSGPTAVLR
jgi:hypothetical protein